MKLGNCSLAGLDTRWPFPHSDRVANPARWSRPLTRTAMVVERINQGATLTVVFGLSVVRPRASHTSIRAAESERILA